MPNPRQNMLNYSSRMTECAPVIEHEPRGGVTITIPTRRTIWRYTLAIVRADLRAATLVPFGWVAYLLLATRKPRAILRLSADKFSLCEWSDDGLGLVATKRSWPFQQIGELRPNRFSPGIYLTIRGRDIQFLLTDLSEADVAIVGEGLAEARHRLDCSNAEHRGSDQSE